ncbi:MAG: hypothetical protein WBL21_06895 [Salinimicrobium sp.]
MKKLIFAVAVLFTAGLSSVSAQELKLGAHAGVPVGDVSDVSDFAFGADLAYLWNVAGILQAGPKIGYHQYTGDFDAGFLPVAAEGRVGLGEAVFVGLDLGYGISLKDGVDGGLYYAPKLGFGFMGVKIIGSYTGISLDGGEASSVNAGIEISL